MGFFKTILITFVIAIVILFGVMTSLGLTFLSRPKDLGTKYTQKDTESFLSKYNMKVNKITDETSENGLVFSGKTEVKDSFSQEELTARFAMNSWKYKSVKDVQVKINSDGSAEMSGRLIKRNIEKNIDRFDLGIDNGIKKKLDLLPVDPVFYIKGKVIVTNNQVDLQGESLKIGSFDIPVTPEIESEVESMVESTFAKVEGLDARKVSFENGKMIVDATIPDTINSVQ